MYLNPLATYLGNTLYSHLERQQMLIILNQKILSGATYWLNKSWKKK